MTVASTLDEILVKAIEKEVGSRQLYLSLSQKMTQQSLREAFQELAQQELGHQNLLERYLHGELSEGALSCGQVVDYKIAERQDQTELSVDMNLPDIFLLAANREKVAHDFYLGFARAHPEGEMRSLLENLAAQELEHKQRVEFLYTEVAFPQTDGG